MRILAVDTTTPSGSVALVEDGRVLGEISVESATTHSARLMASIDHMLRAVGLEIGDVEGFAVSPGPGSFTGIRIGLSTIKSFAFASGKRVAPVSSLRALAAKLDESQAGLVAPMLDAKKGEIYAALLEFRRSRTVTVIPEAAFVPAGFLARIPAHRAVSFIGNGIPLCRELIVRRFASRARFPDRSPFIAAEVGILGQDILAAGNGVPSEKLEPLYFRKSQAEEGR